MARIPKRAELLWVQEHNRATRTIATARSFSADMRYLKLTELSPLLMLLS
jgi:hypothetical protein